ncbi:hypothetical protein SDC9_98406 [bioreactor metagenome]|uniref:Biotin carboxyl carrier protein of acetyl-CoA carboxylase n=1 Tax=bioreactor metagenome TaxID=1076179 RepID=A0A645AEM8_9ZZZZ
MDYKAIENLIKALSDSTVKELEIETNEIKIKMSKNSAKVVLSETTVDKSSYTEGKELIVASDNRVSASNEEVSSFVQGEKEVSKKEVEDENLYTVKSPMVGTFYSSPSENSEPYVKSGDKVNKGTVLCIVEAMKLMNEIESEIEGTIVEVLCKNGQMVEYGEPLFKVKL